MKDEIRHTNLNVKERNRLVLNGVSNIESFDEGYITLEINEGRISVEGSGMKIESLSRDDGEIHYNFSLNNFFALFCKILSHFAIITPCLFYLK